MSIGIRWKLLMLLLWTAVITPFVLTRYVNFSVQKYAAERELLDALNDTELSAHVIEHELLSAHRKLVDLADTYFEDGDSETFRSKLEQLRNDSYSRTCIDAPKRFLSVSIVKSVEEIEFPDQESLLSLRREVASQLKNQVKLSDSVHWLDPVLDSVNGTVSIWAVCRLARGTPGDSSESHPQVFVVQFNLTPVLEAQGHSRNFVAILNQDGEILSGPTDNQFTHAKYPGWNQFNKEWEVSKDVRDSGTRIGYYPGKPRTKDGENTNAVKGAKSKADTEDLRVDAKESDVEPDGFSLTQLIATPRAVFRQSKFELNENGEKVLRRLEDLAKQYQDELRHDPDVARRKLARVELLRQTNEIRARASSTADLDRIEGELFRRLVNPPENFKPIDSVGVTLKAMPILKSKQLVYDAVMEKASTCFVGIKIPGDLVEDTKDSVRPLPKLTIASSVSIEEIKAAASDGLSGPFLFAFVASCILASVGIVVTWYFTKPLSTMTKAAKELSKLVSEDETEADSNSVPLDLASIELPVKRCDEVGDLARAFSEMVHQVTKAKSDLTSRVQQRTKELEESNRELKEQRDKAELADKAKTGFMATVSHEMKTPLHWLNGYAGQLRRTPLNERQAICVDKLFHGIDHLRRLIEDVLDYQKILLGGMSIELESIDLRKLCEEIRESMEGKAQEKNNQLIVDCNFEGKFVTDPRRLTQVITNLMGNALKFTENGKVALTVVPQRGNVLVIVSDSGVGISEEHLKSLFTPFEKRGSKQGNEDGTGLGLVICRELARLLKGDVKVTSQLGKGTIFTVSLPADLDASQNEAVSGWDSFEGMIFSHAREDLKRVLIIDDDPHSTEILKDELASANYLITTAQDGPTGIALAKELRPDLITLDIVMPGMDGWEVLQQLKRDPVTRDIPVVLVTIAGDSRKGFALGANGYLSKPFQPDEMRQVLEVAIGSERGEVLIVDDDAMSREIARDALQGSGIRVIEANDGEEALERIIEKVPDAILLDLNMPRMNGFELLEQLRLRNLNGSMKVIVVSGKTLTSQERSALAGSVCGFLDKTVWDADQLRQELRRQMKQTMSPRMTLECEASQKKVSTNTSFQNVASQHKAKEASEISDVPTKTRRIEKE